MDKLSYWLSIILFLITLIIAMRILSINKDDEDEK